MSDTAELVLQSLREKGPLRTRDIRDELDRLGSDGHRLDLHTAMQRLQRLNLIKRASAPLFEREAPFQLVEKAKGNPMTGAEQRAKGIVDSSLATAGGNPKFRADLVSAITTAILEAENAKLEEAARCAENPGFIQARDTEWDMGVNYAKPFIAAAIRSLISKKD